MFSLLTFLALMLTVSSVNADIFDNRQRHDSLAGRNIAGIVVGEPEAVINLLLTITQFIFFSQAPSLSYSL
jgi:hypothetical protein